MQHLHKGHHGNAEVPFFFLLTHIEPAACKPSGPLRRACEAPELTLKPHSS